MKRIIATALATAALAGAALAEEVNLRTLAVEDGFGNLVVLWNGNTEWWAGNEYTAFDGSTSVAYNPKRVYGPTWTGYELTSPCIVTRIRFCAPARTDNQGRLRACQVQGANQSDFSDAVVLLECKHVVPANWLTGSTYWFDAPAHTFATPQTFRYIRFIQPTDDGEGTTYCGNVTEVEFYGMDATSYASYVPTVADEANLRLYALHDSTGALDILSDKTEPYGSGYEYYRAFDGNVGTFYDPRNNTSAGNYVGYALAKPMAVTRIRYYGRGDGNANSSHTQRLLYCEVQGANESDFSDAVTIHVCKTAVPADWHLHTSWIEAVPTAGIGTFKYLRFIDPAGTHQCGDVSEVEFYGMDADALAARVLADPQPPANLTASRGDYPIVGTFLNWQVPAGVSNSVVIRAPGVNGPWTEVARLNGADVWTDTTAPAGSICRYRVVANFTYGGQSFSATNETAVVAPRRWRLLERDPEVSMTQLRSGVSLIYKGGPNYWTGSSIEDSCMRAFNNQVHSSSSYADHADIKAVTPRTCIGVDIGEQAHLALMRFFPRNNNGNCNGVVLSGSNSADWNLDGNFDTLTDPISGVAGNYTATWMERVSLDTDTAYRYLFCHNPALNGWNDNVSELQLYGWTESDIAGLAAGVENLSATCGSTPSVTLAWTPAKYGTYTIERKVGDGAWTTVASNLPAATATWTDSDVVCDGTRCTYRVTTVNGASMAYSAEREVIPYLAGNGTGLHAEWWTNYVATTGGEMLALVTTNATIDFADASVGGATENLLARWSGKLIAPLAGDFTFEAEAEDVAYLWIDGVAVLYKGKSSATATLTAGEHDVTAMWYHKTGAGSCRILWGGCVTHEVIPSTQLIPVPPRTIPGEWAGARAFDANADSLFLADVKANADGSLDMAHSGRDLSWGTIGYNFLWKPVKGDFTLVAKIMCLPPIGDRWYGRKAGLMVRSSLDAGAMMRAYGVKRTVSGSIDNFYVLGMHKTTATAQYVREQDKVAGALIGSYPASDPATATWVRLRRRGNVFTAHYKYGQMANWALEYEYVDANGEYGETTYVGLSAWGEGDGTYTTVPCYLWRFSEVSLTTPRGFIMVVR
jgi:hypothetical protein